MTEILFMVQRVTIFILVASILTNLFAGTEYKKYFQFAMGLITIALVITPLVSLFQRETSFSQWLEKELVEQEILEKKEEIEILGENFNREIQREYIDMVQNYESEKGE